MTIYYYLHGFASGLTSAKARFLGDRFRENHLPLITPDMNQDDFSHLTLTRQIQQVAATFPDTKTPVTIIGSSLGGLTAAWLGQKYPQIERLILLAPAFGFLPGWESRLGQENVQEWRKSGYLKVYHYSFQEIRPIHYGLITDLQKYPEEQLTRSIPTLIIHGRKDEVIPIDRSLEYAKARPWVQVIELDSDHGLDDVLEKIWQIIRESGLLL
jgi:pimeloyl-ACP methyl ester carboxylesterase